MMSDSNTSADLFDDDLLVDIPDGSDSREVSDSDDGVQIIEDSTLHENVSDEDSANEDEPDVTVDFTGVTTSTPISHSDGDETEEISEGEGDTPVSAVQPHRTFRVLISVLDLTEFDGSDTSEAVINPDDISSPSEEEEDKVEESNTANDNRRRLPTRAARTRATRAIGALSRPRQPPNASSSSVPTSRRRQRRVGNDHDDSAHISDTLSSPPCRRRNRGENVPQVSSPEVVVLSDSEAADDEVASWMSHGDAKSLQEERDREMAMRLANEQSHDSSLLAKYNGVPKKPSVTNVLEEQAGPSGLSSTQNGSSGITCVICFEEGSSVKIPMACLHCRQLIGCKGCIKKWFKTTNISTLNRHSPLSRGLSHNNHHCCPLCRVEWSGEPEVVPHREVACF